VRRADSHGNAASGVVHALDARRNVVHADGNAVVLYGVDDLVVVASPGLTLVTTVDRSSDLKSLVESLPRRCARPPDLPRVGRRAWRAPAPPPPRRPRAVPDTRPPLYLYDDAAARAFEPFASTRPAGELRAGAELVRRRWERALGARAAGFLSAPHLDGFVGVRRARGGRAYRGAAERRVAGQRALRPSPRRGAGDAQALVCDGRVAAVRLPAPLAAPRLADGALAFEAVLDPGTPAPRRWRGGGWTRCGTTSGACSRCSPTTCWRSARTAR
jgi:hypothetical protein